MNNRYEFVAPDGIHVFSGHIYCRTGKIETLTAGIHQGKLKGKWREPLAQLDYGQWTMG